MKPEQERFQHLPVTATPSLVVVQFEIRRIQHQQPQALEF